MTKDEITDAVSSAVSREFSALLGKFGLDDDDHQELRADFIHLRKWRKSVEQAQSYTMKTVITVVIGGFLGALWLGIKATLGK